MTVLWPPKVRVKPIITWPGEQTRNRHVSPFSAAWAATLDLLDRELSQISARNTVLQVAIEERDFRLDGYPRANARQLHPGVILTFDSKHGPLSYPCDTFADWRDNLRAIVLAMESLRRVDRYGVTKRGEQYAGWKQLPAGSNGSSSFASADEAMRWMRSMVTGAGPNWTARDYYRVLARSYHPDAGGSRDDWDRLDHARRVLEAGGLL